MIFIDVIGLLVSRSPLTVTPTGQRKWMDIYLENLEFASSIYNYTISYD